MSEAYPRTVKTGEWYPLAEGERAPDGLSRAEVRAVATDEYRAPMPGEWFLSGATVEAYQARGSGGTAMWIARLVRAEIVTRWVPMD